ncbi:MAG: hypothetical protein SGBAC_009048 [Bacillariaceae sp.]
MDTDNDNDNTAPPSPTSVDMCGLVTDDREADDAAAETTLSFITDDDSLSEVGEQVVADFVVGDTDGLSILKALDASIRDETTNVKEAETVEEETEDRWALSSVVSWISQKSQKSAGKEATTQPIDNVPASVLQSSGENRMNETDGNDDDNDDVSLGNVSLASVLSSIGYVSTGSKASSSSRRSVFSQHSSQSKPEAHLLQMPHNLLDDISTGSIELLFEDDGSVSPSLADIQCTNQSVKNLLNTDDAEESNSVKCTSDAGDNSDLALPADIVNDVSTTPAAPMDYSKEADDSTTPPQNADITESTLDSNDPVPIVTTSTSPPFVSLQASVVSENGSTQDGWGSDSSDIESAMPKQHLTNDDYAETPSTKAKDLLNTSDDTASTTNEQNSDEEDDDSTKGISSIETKPPTCCEKWPKHGSFVYCILLIIAASLIVVLGRDAQATTSAALEEEAAAIPDDMPSGIPSQSPSLVPSTSQPPSFIPSDLPSMVPSDMPSTVPSTLPSMAPTQTASSMPSYEELKTIFYAIGDVPYNNREKIQLQEKTMPGLPEDGEFLIHVGDIRVGNNPNARCRREEYMEVRDILRQSPIPVFIIPGDNEWTDCRDPKEAQRFWLEAFHNFENNWNHTFSVERYPSRPENFHFVHKRTLFFGLNLVGGDIEDRSAFALQLDEQFEWMKQRIDQHVNTTQSVVIFGHAFPRRVHDSFFLPLQRYIQIELKEETPIMYLNGDYHFYDFEQNFMGLRNMQRLQVDFGTVNPPLQVAVTVSGDSSWQNTFTHDRML